MHPCATCASLQRTCCQRADILVTDGDLQRIQAHTGRADFWERRAPHDPEYLHHDEDDPNWLLYTVFPDGTRRVLKKKPEPSNPNETRCGFLGDAGCTLPMEVRPIVCRLYPFSFTERGLAPHEDPDYCPTALLAPAGSGLTMLTVLGMTPGEGERWRSQLYAELKADHAAGRAGHAREQSRFRPVAASAAPQARGAAC